jgi:cobaltochelatase CobT
MSYLKNLLARLFARGREREAATGPYKIFTTQYDEIIAAQQLMHDEIERSGRYNLRALQEKLSLATASISPVFAEDFSNRWHGGHPLGPRPFLSLLIDHSGSMKGANALAAAVAAHYVGTAFERLDVAYEVLGFTTVNWRGGRSRKKWINMGRPKHPGRLCDIRYIVYRDQSDGGKEWTKGLVALLADDLLKENVDAEAILWARSRTLEYLPTTWICLTISDGAPVDDSTINANGGTRDSWYLMNHLKAIISGFLDDPQVRIGGVGIKYSVSGVYPYCTVADPPELTAQRAFELLHQIVWEIEVN